MHDLLPADAANQVPDLEPDTAPGDDPNEDAPDDNFGVKNLEAMLRTSWPWARILAPRPQPR